MIEIRNTPFAGLLVLGTDCFADARGGFQKMFNYDFFVENGLATDFKEFYFSTNRRDVIRGMHFQTPPYDHEKLVYVSAGSITDVVVDIRRGSATYGKCFSIRLSAEKGEYLYIPKGFAHGFRSLEDNTVVNYAQTTCYERDHDCGIDAMSIGFDWETTAPVRSGRDLSFVKLKDFNSPFQI